MFEKGHKKSSGTKEWYIGPRLRSWLFKQLIARLFGVNEDSAKVYFARNKMKLTEVDDVAEYIRKNKEKI